MGGFFGVSSKNNCLSDVFFGTDYHSHLGTRSGGVAAYDKEIGLQREIHNISNSPFRTKFEKIFTDMEGTSAIGCISDTDPQPLLIRSNLGNYAICIVGIINNKEELIDRFLSFSGGHFNAMTGSNINSTELVAALINQKSDFTEGLRFAQKSIEGTASILVLKDNGNIIAARDRVGRLPVIIGKRDDGYAVTFESFACQKLGYEYERELGPGEIVEISPESVVQLSPPGKKKRICAFLWSYYGYPTSTYEGVNVEIMRNRNGAKSVHMRSACPPIMFGCKYLNFSRSTSDMELIARRVIVELEGEEGLKYIEEYSDGSTERGKALREAICKKFNFSSLEFQTLEGIIKAIGIDACDLCTYCWNGKE